jgi:hypothetical protein
MLDAFQTQFLPYLEAVRTSLATADGMWRIKGFIDVAQTIYALSSDTKVLSKLLEMSILPIIEQFAREQNFLLRLPEAQNHYPDFTLISRTNPRECYALDLKSTYRVGADQNGAMRVNGLTLGTFGGYFRARTHTTGITLPYSMYLKHYVLGMVYSRVDTVDARNRYRLQDLQSIPSAARDFVVFLHEKYRIASDQPGSGNTRNIGSTKFLDRLVNGTGGFSQLGVEIFDDYWMHYRTRRMASEEGFDQPPYTDLPSYRRHKLQSAQILSLPDDLLLTENDTPSLDSEDEL